MKEENIRLFFEELFCFKITRKIISKLALNYRLIARYRSVLPFYFQIMLPLKWIRSILKHRHNRCETIGAIKYLTQLLTIKCVSIFIYSIKILVRHVFLQINRSLLGERVRNIPVCVWNLRYRCGKSCVY